MVSSQVIHELTSSLVTEIQHTVHKVPLNCGKTGVGGVCDFPDLNYWICSIFCTVNTEVYFTIFSVFVNQL
jgi:hypothetical protein